LDYLFLRLQHRRAITAKKLLVTARAIFPVTSRMMIVTWKDATVMATWRIANQDFMVVLTR
jgi:hypothetical protein